MQPGKRKTNVEEAVAGVIGVLLVAVFLGFMAVDIGSIPLFVVTAIVLAMAITDLVQTLRGGDDSSH